MKVVAWNCDLSYLVVSGRMVGQLLLEELTERPVLSLQVKHQHLQLDALLPQILQSRITVTFCLQLIQGSEGRGLDLRQTEVWHYLLIKQSLDHMIGHLFTKEKIITELRSGAAFSERLIPNMHSPRLSNVHKLPSGSHSPTSERSSPPANR